MLNTLANHGYISRDGLNITLAELQNGFTEAINLAPDFSVRPWATGLLASTTGNNFTLNLNDLIKHNVIEHDASLSRLDTYFGDADVFNDAVWAEVNSTFGLDVVTVEQTAKSRAARIAKCAEENPEYNLTASGAAAGWGEAALFLAVMGDKITGNASREFVEVFFKHERLPFEEGWVRQTEVIESAEITALTQKVIAAAT